MIKCETKTNITNPEIFLVFYYPASKVIQVLGTINFIYEMLCYPHKPKYAIGVWRVKDIK